GEGFCDAFKHKDSRFDRSNRAFYAGKTERTMGARTSVRERYGGRLRRLNPRGSPTLARTQQRRIAPNRATGREPAAAPDDSAPKPSRRTSAPPAPRRRGSLSGTFA